MIYPSDLKTILQQWETTVQHYSPSSDCHKAVSRCISDIQHLLNQSHTDDLTYEDFLSMEADEYLSSIEAHDNIQ